MGNHMKCLVEGLKPLISGPIFLIYKSITHQQPYTPNVPLRPLPILPHRNSGGGMEMVVVVVAKLWRQWQRFVFLKTQIKQPLRLKCHYQLNQPYSLINNAISNIAKNSLRHTLHLSLTKMENLCLSQSPLLIILYTTFLSPPLYSPCATLISTHLSIEFSERIVMNIKLSTLDKFLPWTNLLLPQFCR